MWVLGFEPDSSERAASALNCPLISPAPTHVSPCFTYLQTVPSLYSYTPKAPFSGGGQLLAWTRLPVNLLCG